MIALQGVSVKYRIVEERKRSFQEHFINYVKGKRVLRQTLWALRDVSLDVAQGESLGIIGPNGAGKSTLLKVISGVIKPYAGTANVKGKTAPLIELAAGFDDQLTGRENIFLNASILGFSRREIEERFDRIVDFSELKEFIDTPLKHYSSGMTARLAFSVATEVDPDILIIDEVLAVGDAHFRQRSKERILEFKNKGVIILFVSHDMEQVKGLCNKVLWLDHGSARMLGAAEEVVAAYEKDVVRGDVVKTM
ncbi:MAG TPA: ABC transporter ATP-binding protein [Thermodesulfovibrionales bacterium]|nr:ABC transporter ATP-binding protein [Thermodesulfovibrionales bacterium]